MWGALLMKPGRLWHRKNLDERDPGLEHADEPVATIQMIQQMLEDSFRAPDVPRMLPQRFL